MKEALIHLFTLLKKGYFATYWKENDDVKLWENRKYHKEYYFKKVITYHQLF